MGGLLALEVRTGQGREEKHSKARPAGSEDGRLRDELHLHSRKESVRTEYWARSVVAAKVGKGALVSLESEVDPGTKGSWD